ncbi:MAG: FHA domain-containing protein, partial [Chloroflexi bacterium]
MLSLTKGRETIMSAVLKGPFGQVDLGPTPLTIGRTPGNQLVLAEPKVSSHHAEIRPQGQDYAIVDLGSTNGTFVNDQRLASNVPSMLRTGDTIVIGDTRITYEVPGSAGTEPTVFAGSRQGSGPSYTPTVAAPFPPNTGYGADAQQPGAYQPPPPPPAGYEQASYPPSSPYYGTPVAGYGEGAQPGAYQSPPPVAPGYGPSGYPQAGSYPGAPAPAAPPTQRPNRRRLWTILGAIGGLVLIAIILIVVFVVMGNVNRSTPTKTLDAYCSALKSG